MNTHYDSLKEKSETRQVPVKLWCVEEEPITIYVEGPGQEAFFRAGDEAIWTFKSRFAWEDAHPFKAFLFRWGVIQDYQWEPYPGYNDKND